ncbi:MAG: ABC transporter ATP-binding protein, partial [Nitriliruptoraceae bacterium]
MMPAAGDTGLHADVRARAGSFALDVSVSASAGEIVAVVGPNGAGKSTLLRVIAGLHPLDSGVIRLDGRVLDAPADNAWVSVHERDIGVVFADLRLFPHLSALDNVAFGLRARGIDVRAARAQARDWLDRVGLAEAADARPGALSSGQAQRVALARALAPEPRLLVLDEPLSALDVATRRDIRRVLDDHLHAFAGPVLVVTHEPLEAINLADRVAVIESGRVVQDAAPVEIARRPRSPWAARLVGINLFRGVASDEAIDLDAGGALAVSHGLVPGTRVLAAVHPRAVALHT